jgi:hypothetical protein
MRKLKIGDKIKWNLPIGGNTIYTILDIDILREQTVLITPNKTYHFDNQILLQWQEWDGRITQSWGYSLDEINQEIARGRISILNSEIEPCKHLTRFSFGN